MSIKGIVGAGGTLYLRTESGQHTLKNNGKEPMCNRWSACSFNDIDRSRENKLESFRRLTGPSSVLQT